MHACSKITIAGDVLAVKDPSSGIMISVRRGDLKDLFIDDLLKVDDQEEIKHENAEVQAN